MSLLEFNNVTKFFPVRRGMFKRGASEFVHALNGVSFSVEKGETVGLVGESGCGKSTLGRLAVGLHKPTSGQVIFDGQKKDIQIIFQDPFSSLNPRMSVGDIISEPLIIHKLCKKGERFLKAGELLEAVGLEGSFARRYPHEFSGGQRQRIGIARAIALRPKLIVADEPVSSLDVAIQAEVLDLLKELRKKYGVSYLFISHDLRIVASLCNRIAVMYLGKIAELMAVEGIKSPLHPYTEALISAVPVADPKIKKKRIILKGDVPSPIRLPSGCFFHPRCPYAEEVCKVTEPVLREIKQGHFTACHFPEKVGHIWDLRLYS